MLANWRYLLAGAAGIGAIYTLLLAMQAYRSLNRVRVPTTDKLLRPPGESLNREIAKLDDRLLWGTFLILGGPFFFAHGTQFLSPIPFVAGLFAVTALCAVPLWIIVSHRRNYLVGLLGERAVGEELNQLLREGCHVFHDYPGGPNWNIDHIVVAPSGVYAIETKTPRKRRGRAGTRDHEVIFDGKLIHFPFGSDAHGLDQARRNAASLSQQLTSATGEPVKVKPILTFPGWLVTLKGKSDVHVLNPKQIHQVVLNSSHAPSSPLLSPAQMQRIIHQLDQKCRDVEL